MENLSLTDVVAVIGCITGCASLFIEFYKIALEKGALHVRTNKFFNKYFNRLPESDFLTKYQAIIYIEIVNSTSHPLTIYDIDIWLKDGHYSPDKCPVEQIVLKQKFHEIVTNSKINMRNSFVTPYTLDPFHVYKGYIFICQFLSQPKNTEPFVMAIRTTRKTKYLLGNIKKHQYQID